MAESTNDRRDDGDDKEDKAPSGAEKSEREQDAKAAGGTDDSGADKSAKAKAAGGADDSGADKSAKASKDVESDKKQAEPEVSKKPSDYEPKKTVPQSPKAKAAAPAAKQEPGLMTPTNIALLLAAGGLLAFWKGVSIFKTDGRDYYSASAWLFVIAFFAVTVSAFHFLGGQLPKPGEKVQKLESRLLESLVPSLPFFALYAVIWWVAWDAWKALYPGNSWMWMFFIGLAACTWGTWHGLKPPSPQEMAKDELPTRRVILLLMVPFVAVFGMIWLAERVAGR